ncbi:hypothetical protein dqs_3440 [Azoarcus olearius]|nr:hypothetical protein dqs_3440 [Azoarcus olearius]
MDKPLDRRRANRRLALAHALLALVFFCVVIVKYRMFGL